jgi:S-DNA-T family DNA segregation ATPase FtsK/SpoIIIE
MAPKGNRIKHPKDEEVEELVNEKRPSRKEKTRSAASTTNGENWLKARVDFLKDERFQKIAGLFFILLSVYMLIAFTSFFLTWKADSDKVNGPWLSLLFDSSVRVDNWLGKLGAILSHTFIQNWFGVSAFVFVLLSFLTGFRILFGIQLMPFSKTLKYSIFGFFFVAATLAYVIKSTSSYLFLAGSVGLEINKWLQSILGYAGTGILLLFSSVAFLVAVFNFAFKLPTFLTQKNKETEPEESPDEVIEALESLAGNKLKNQTSVSKIELETEIPEDEDTIFTTEEKGSPSISFDLDNESVPVPVAATEMEIEIPADHSSETHRTPDAGVPLSIENLAGEGNNNEEVEIANTEVLGEYDPKLDLSSYQFPTLDLLENHASKSQLSRDELKAELEANKNRIVETLGHYNIAIDKIKATVGPTVTLFEIIPQAGVRISKIKNLEDDIALSLSALGIRIIAPIPGKGTIGIEVPNQSPEVVSMRSVIASEKFQNCDYDLPIALGRTISNEVFIADLAKMPHMLMAGATGQGKSVGLNAVLVSLLYKKHPSQVKFVLVDPKKVELTLFKTIERHFLAKLPGEEEAIITDTRKVVNTLNSLCIEMDQRYELLKDAQVRNIREYNARFVSRRLNPNNGHRFLPFIVLVVDEFADLIMTAGKEVETPIARLAQLARAIGIHLIIATQRPSVNIITGTIKANFPARLAFRVASKIDSRTILDTGGADQLIGRGDMLLSTGSDIIRLQCAFVDTPEVEQITEFIGGQRGYPEAFQLPEYVGEGEGSGGSDYDASDRDPLFEEAARMVVEHQQGSASLLQRRLKLGYNRAGRLIDQLEAAGIIGPFEGSKARQVKIKDPLSLEQFLNVGDKT